MSEQVRVILNEDGLKITRNSDDAHFKESAICEHRLTRTGGFGRKLRNVCAAVRGVPGVSHAYASPELDGGTVFFGLTNDEPGQYLPVARLVVDAVKTAL